MFTVEKIGGTSMSDFAQVLNNIILNQPLADGRIIVVSAYSGITDLLLEYKKSGQPGVYTLFLTGQDYSVALFEVCKKMQKINQSLEKLGLNRQLADQHILFRTEIVKKQLNGMSEVINSGYTDKKIIQQAAREMLASLGEVHSAFNTYQIINSHSLPVRLADLSGFGDNEILTIDQRILKTITRDNSRNILTIATGYTRGSEGIMNSFDRGYSEITFSRIAALLKSDEAIIHKEFHLSSADPKLVGTEKAKPVGQISFEIAAHLANIGMEAIHPQCACAIEAAGINLRVKNTFEPNHPGTLISSSHFTNNSGVQIISGCDGMTWLEITGGYSISQINLESKFNDLMDKHNLKIVFKTSNADNITAIVNEKQLSEAVKTEISRLFSEGNYKNVAILNMLGNNLTGENLLTDTVCLLKKHNIKTEHISLSLRKKNLQMIISRKDYCKAITILHRNFCEVSGKIK